MRVRAFYGMRLIITAKLLSKLVQVIAQNKDNLWVKLVHNINIKDPY